jgi:hypothetical protein
MKLSKQYEMTVMAVAFVKSGFKLRKKRVAWPRNKGPKGLRVEVGTLNVVSVVN